MSEEVGWTSTSSAVLELNGSERSSRRVFSPVQLCLDATPADQQLIAIG